MKAALKIEAIGDNVDQELKLYRDMTNFMMPGLGDMTFGKSKRNYWVAKITGYDSKYHYEREFLKGRKDYRKTNSKGSRGIYLWYTLESGYLYEVSSPSSWKRRERYFCIVTDKGEIKQVDEEYVEQWIKNILE